jgi:nitroreductase
MRAHSSVRRYTDEPISDETIREAVATAQMAATSSHVQAYSLLRITDPETRERLVTLTGNQRFTAEAGAFFVVCGDLRRHQLVAARHGERAVQNLETFILAAVDASLFAQNLVLALESLGLGICYIGGLRNRLPDVDALLELPHGVLPFYGLSVGHVAEKPEVKPRLPLGAVLFEDRYPDDETMLAEIDAYDGEMARYYEGRGLPGRNWSGGIRRKFAKATREHLARYYTSKGAVLE